MTLVAVTKPAVTIPTGRLKFIAAEPPGGWDSGVQEPQNGWVICNGAVLTRTGKYIALFDKCPAGKYGASNGQLPRLLEGRNPIPKGATLFTTVGAAGDAITVTLDLNTLPSHYHYQPDHSWYVGGPWHIDPYDNGTARGVWENSSSAGGGGAHNNMPPYQVGGYWLVKL